jgi:TonB family protein
MAELRRGIDALLFSGDFTPTTFDLAFFMHTLFREAVERDARAVEEARAADYREFLTEEAPKAASGSPQTEPVDAQPKAAEPEAAALATTEVQPPTAPDPAARPAAPPAPAKAAGAAGPDASHPRLSARAAREAGARDATSRSGVGLAPAAAAGAAKRRASSPGLWLGIGVAAALVLGGGGGWLYFVRQRPAAPPAPTAEQVAAEARVRELEARIALLETEKAAAEARAAEEARLAVEKQAAAGGQTADPEAIQRAQDEARRRARLEQERQQQEELQRLADEKRAEEQRLAAAVATAAAVSAAATPLPAPVSTPTPVPAELIQAPSSTSAPQPRTAEAAAQPQATPPQAQPQAPSTQATPGVPVAGSAPSTGRLAPADPADPAVRAPALLSEDPVPYPRRGAALRLTTTVTVVVRALIDETGRVTEASISQGSGQPAEVGFDEAALRRVRSRRYRPARRHDVPVPIWVVIRVEFRPPPTR